MATCHHGRPIVETWEECPECRTEHDVAEMDASAKRQSDIQEHITETISNLEDSGRDPPPEEKTIQRLAADPTILDNFIKRQDCYWDHQAWLGLLDELERAGYTPFNPDQVGLLLETRRNELRGKT